MRTKQRSEKTVHCALKWIIAGSVCLGGSEALQAAEKKSYKKPSLTAYSSQMPDALLGNDKYEKPVWNLHDALNLPKWLDISVEQRTRYETMDGRFRAGAKGGDQQIPLQTDLWLQANMDHFRVGAEFMDSRALGADTGSTLNNTHENTSDFVQGYVAWADQNVFNSGIGAEVIAGRQTINLGSRRLVARNAFRNTLNNFTGIRLRLLSYGNWQFNGFVAMPVIRYPNDKTNLLDENHQFDEEDTHTWFSGGLLEMYDLAWNISGEVYLYHLDEGDSINNPTRNRRYFTPGVRFYSKPKKAKFDFQLETIGQLGTVRSSTSSNSDLNHAAWFQHIDAGYTFDMPWTPRLAVEYDYASGDDNPNDNKDQRFDTLYGVRRGPFGPTGIYGAFARSNINTPGLRIKMSPNSDLKLELAHRAFWLASSRDSWTTAKLQDTGGRSDNYIGQQLELLARWDFNSSLNFETGWAHLFKGQFAKTAPNAPNAMDVDYFYVQSQLRF